MSDSDSQRRRELAFKLANLIQRKKNFNTNVYDKDIAEIKFRLKGLVKEEKY